MNKRLDLVGEVFGSLAVTEFSHIGKGGSYWLCRCECGVEKSVPANALTRGKTVSCGCHKRRLTRERSVKHAMSKHPGYNSFKAMHLRCDRKTHIGYASYGGRGITICEAWRTFDGFWADMGSAWSDGLTLDRIDPNGNYEPGNCRWATKIEQGRNRRNNRIVHTPDGEMNLSAAVERFGIGQKTIVGRIAMGITDPHELFAPVGTYRRRAAA